MKNLRLILAMFAMGSAFYTAKAQHTHDPGPQKDVELHVNPRWEECSFQLDASLTQKAWREFTKEAGLVTYFRPLIDAKPMGARNFEVSLLQWYTAFDDTKDAWNDTFVHPDSAHWLKESSRLSFPGLTFRAGITNRLDVALYITKSPGANYGFYGAQVQYNLMNNLEKKFSTSARASFVKMYGPQDMEFTTYGVDLIVSKEFVINEKWLTVAPYVTASTYLAAAREKSEVTNVKDEQVLGLHTAGGLVANVKFMRLAVEYNAATVNTVSVKIGAAF